MKRYLNTAIMLLLLTSNVGAFAEDGEPQLEHFLKNQTGKASTSAHASAALLERAFHAMYDLNFSEADSDLALVVMERPEDPLGPAAQAASALFSIFEKHQILQSELFTSDARYSKRRTVTPDAAALHRFDSALVQAEALASQALAKNAHDENALFALTLVYGLRADYAALVEHRDLAALRFSEQGNERARQLLAFTPEFYDAYVATGMQKYLVGLRPAPVRWMLRIGGIKGDREQGIHELELAAAHGHYLAPFARILLAVAHLRKDERKEAANILAELRQQFPGNPLFSEELARIEPANADGSRQTSSLSNGSTRRTSCEAQ